MVEAAQDEIDPDPRVHAFRVTCQHNHDRKTKPSVTCFKLHVLPGRFHKQLTFLLPRNDLGVGGGEQEVKIQGNVGDQVLQDGRLLAATTKETTVSLRAAR